MKKKSKKVIVRHKKTDILRAFWFFLPYVRANMQVFSWGVVGVLLSAFSILSIGRVLSHLVDSSMQYYSREGLTHLFVITFPLLGILSLGSFLRAYTFGIFGEKVAWSLMTRLHRHCMRLDLKFFDQKGRRTLGVQLVADVKTLARFLSSTLPFTLRYLITILGGLLMIVFSSWLLSLLVLCVVPVFGFSLVFLMRKMRHVGRVMRVNLEKLERYLMETIEGIEIVKIFCREQKTAEELEEQAECVIQSVVKKAFYKAICMTYTIFLLFCFITVLLWVGGYSVHAGTLTQGGFYAFVFYTVLLGTAFSGLIESMDEMQQVVSMLLSADEVFSIVPKNSSGFTSSAGDDRPSVLSLQGVYFCYPNGKENALTNVSLEIQPQENVAIIGMSGAGKSTLCHLLLGFYEPSEGRVIVGKHSSKEGQASRQCFTYASHKSVLFDNTLRYNLCYASGGFSENALEEVLWIAGLEDLIKRLPEGLETQIGAGGIDLSSGQKQRIMIARALLKRSGVLLFDEAMSALDLESERAIYKKIMERRKYQTKIFVTHRIGMIRAFKKIVVLDDGYIDAVGSHDLLLEKSRVYARLCHLHSG